MTIPDYQALMLPVLRLAAAGEMRVPEAAERIADALGLTAEERDELLPSGRQRVLHNRIHWAKFYMAKAGLIASPARGRFTATETGRTLAANPPERLDTRYLKIYPAFQAFYNRQEAPDTEEGVPPAAASPPVAESQATPEEQIWPAPVRWPASNLMHGGLVGDV